MDIELSIAVAQPHTATGAVDANVDAHAALIDQSRARLVVFPELSLTGYQLDTTPIDIASDVLGPLVSICAAMGSVALVGAPVLSNGRHYIATVLVDSSGPSVVYRKTYLGDDEQARFCPGPGPQVIDLDGWRIGLGICRDTGVDEHINGTAQLGVDLYACGVVHHEWELAEQQRRARNIAATCRAPVAMASFAGPTGAGYLTTAGHSAIWSAESTLIVQADHQPSQIARTALIRKPAQAAPTRNTIDS
ncbi:amidohydrolase [Mycolicibacterium canariasense]|uniref:Amidohydrolase n=1 Tax=Mycolicibacterium canariasense TaxID=228230 RepID=A0A117IBX6_MYCCR|nr:carbon-nitrogen hydrolase family protein [Mycolicibacterium canariasense]MCV7211166.1 carbon-nitrogen hydrolase family protein [Mycolicibacterium canariasense]ORV09334.1 nitrilase [Mycolicibacterium canariasense]GAS98597.1 amidohydrolase [Mycolicibacterium canariasense]